MLVLFDLQALSLFALLNALILATIRKHYRIE
jgi:hypothetical protein